MKNFPLRLLSDVGMFCLLAAAATSSARAETPQETSDTQDAPGEIIVTAQKRSESINSVPMSITAATGEQLLQQGIVDPSQLSKIVPSFVFTQTGYGTPVYTIRGVGYQDNTLAAAPAVSVYVDEVPIPFPAETLGTGLDLERVEVLKGPQGILYGENSTGGAVNYIAAKPTSTFQTGFDGSYGRFNSVNLQGFVSGPLSDTLKVRASARLTRSDDWQYDYLRADSNGAADKLMGRLLLDWQPVSQLSVAVNFNAWRDRSDSQAPQAIGLNPVVASVGLYPPMLNYPLAPANDRAADWTAGRSLQMDNTFYQASVRASLALTDEIDLTSITSYEHYKRYMPMDADGTSYQNLDTLEKATVNTVYQELRVTGGTDRLNWMIGGNYETDHVGEY
jgi:outer membrane receptor protein involved in Fe transport